MLRFGFLDDRDWGGQGIGDWEEEKIAAEQLVAYVNQLEPLPRMLVICGDLVHNMPAGTETKYTNVKWCEEQRVDFAKAFGGLRPEIPLVVLPGNHDVGNAPTVESLAAYTSCFGDDYFAYWLGGVRCIVLNTQLFSDSTLAQDMQAQQELWFLAILEEVREKQPKHVLIFQHIPWFIDAEDEPRGYFNIPCVTRSKWLQAIASVVDADGRPLTRAVFCGHFHNNVLSHFGAEGSGGKHKVESIITSSIGRQIARAESAKNQDLGIRSEFKPGCRLVQVGEEGIRHEYVELADHGLPNPEHPRFPELWNDLVHGRPGEYTARKGEMASAESLERIRSTFLNPKLASRLRKLARNTQHQREARPLRKVLVILGPPGCGKGSHAPPIAEALHQPYVSSGQAIRDYMVRASGDDASDEHSEAVLGSPKVHRPSLLTVASQANTTRVRDLVKKGMRAPDEYAVRALRERIEHEDCANGFVLDGFPRSRDQCEKLDELLKDAGCKIWKVLQIVVNNKELLQQRLTGRWVHPHSKKPYHVQHNPPASFVAAGGWGVATPSVENMRDDHDGLALIQREDDSPAAVERQLDEYHGAIFDIVEYYQQKCDFDVLSKSTQDLREMHETVEHQDNLMAQAQGNRLLVQIDGTGDIKTVGARVWNQIH